MGRSWSIITLGMLAACGTKDGLAEADFTTASLGRFTTDATGEVDIPVDVEEGWSSALLYCGPYTFNTRATASRIVEPGGTVVYDAADPELYAFRVGTFSDMLPVLLPVSPDADLIPGTWTVRVRTSSEVPITIECNALYRTAPPIQTGQIDLRLVFVGVDEEAPQLNAAEAHLSESLDTTLTSVAGLWLGAGLTVGNVDYVDFDGDVDTYREVEGANELGSLFRTAPGNGIQELVYFFVSGISTDAGTVLASAGAGTPGVPIVGGTSRSGIAITVADLAAGNTDATARRMAREGLRFLGLFSTTSSDGITDPLADTPACTSDDDSDGVYSTAECAGAGPENLMWWDDEATGTELTEDQAWVLARSAVAR